MSSTTSSKKMHTTSAFTLLCSLLHLKRVYFHSSPASGVEHSPLFSGRASDANFSETTTPTDSFHPSAQPSPQQSEYHLPSHSHLVCTPIVPPPSIRSRKRDSSVVPRRVVCPPRESCYKYVTHLRDDVPLTNIFWFQPCLINP